MSVHQSPEREHSGHLRWSAIVEISSPVQVVLLACKVCHELLHGGTHCKIRER